MIAYSALTGTFGMFIVFQLNRLMAWRTVALVCMFVPILAVLALLFVSIVVLLRIPINFKCHSFEWAIGARDANVAAPKTAKGRC